MKLYSLLTTFYLLTLSVLFFSCNHSRTISVPSKECIALNNDAGKHLTNSYRYGDTALNKAITLFEQAVACDSTFITAYLNLTIAYDNKGSYDKEMVIYNKLLNLIPNDAVIFEQKAELFERMKKLDSAKKYYALANIGFQKRLAKDPGNDKTIADIVELKAITNGENAAKEELDHQIKMHPELSSKLGYEYENLRLFNRESAVFRKTIVSKDSSFNF